MASKALKAGVGILIAGVIGEEFIRSFWRERKAKELAARLVTLARDRGIPETVHIGPPDSGGQPHPFPISEIKQWARGKDLEALEMAVAAVERGTYRIGNLASQGIRYLQPYQPAFQLSRAEDDRVSGEYARDTLLDLEPQVAMAGRANPGTVGSRRGRGSRR